MSYSENEQTPNIDGGTKKQTKTRTPERTNKQSTVFSVIAAIVYSLYFPIKRHYWLAENTNKMQLIVVCEKYISLAKTHWTES